MKSISNSQILNTKLYKPPVKDYYVIRQRIIDLLEKNVHNPLSLIVAGTGYGKSVTVSQWMDHTKFNYCWLSLDDEFNDVQTFLSYLVHSIQSVFSSTMQEINSILQEAEIPPTKVLVNLLINELDQLNEQFIIVLDDYHKINNSQIHDIINVFIKYPPATLHLVILTRYDPPLSLNKLRSFGNITEVRMSALSFTPEEISILVDKTLHSRISEKQTEELFQKTEGWIVAIRLALKHIAQSENIEKTIKELKTNEEYFTQYLQKEILAKLEKPLRKLFLVASISDRFNRGLLEAMIIDGDEHSDYLDIDYFKRLINKSMFIIRLDEQGQWYRFHNLFHNFLLRQLEKNFTKEQISDLHKRASNYFHDNNFIDESLQHAKKSGDISLLVQIIEHHRLELMDSDQFFRLWKWLKMLPAAEIEKHAKLLLSQSFINNIFSDYNSMRRNLIAAKKLFDYSNIDSSQNKDLLGEYYSMYACLSYKEGDMKESFRYSNKSLDLLHVNTVYLRDFARAYMTFSLNATGQSEDAVEKLNESLRTLSSSQIKSRVYQLVTLSMLYTLQGNLNKAMKVAKKYDPICKENKLWVSYIYALYFQGTINYQWNELSKVTSILNVAEKYRYKGRIFWVLNCMFTRILTFHAQKNTYELALAMQNMRDFAHDLDINTIQQLVNAFEVELKLLQNNLDAALELSEHVNFDAIPPSYHFYNPQFTYIKLLISIGSLEKITEAENRLNKLHKMGYLTNNSNFLLQAICLQSVLYKVKGDENLALKKLKEVITLAEPGGYIRIFLDLGGQMQEMIESLKKTRPEDVYLGKIAYAFKQEEKMMYNLQQKKNTTLQTPRMNAIDKITKREINLLRLVADGYQNKEIADKLFLSSGTVKTYLYRIYQKLNVNNRTSALARATELGYLTREKKPTE